MCDCEQKIKELESKIDQLMRWGTQLSYVHCYCNQVTDIRGYHKIDCWPLWSHEKPKQEKG